MAEPTPERRREILRELTQEGVASGGYGDPVPERQDLPEQSDVQMALDRLDDLMSASEPLSDEDLDAIDAWANNAQLDIMRHRRLTEGRRG